MTTVTKAVGYYRVSTKKQGKSGLGIDAQQEMVRNFCKSNNIDLIQEFIEVETGKGADALVLRPVLKSAMALAAKEKAAVIVAKLDRLARNVQFIAGLISDQVPFYVAELGLDTDPFVLHMYAALGEKERDLTSQRTKSGLAQARLRGRVLGGANILDVSKLGHVANHNKAREFAMKLKPIIEPMLAQGLSHLAIAKNLSMANVPTPTSKTLWRSEQVKRIVQYWES